MAADFEFVDDSEETTSEEESAQETTSAEEERAASSSDSQAANDESTDEKEGSEESGSAKGRSPKLQKLLDKYQGDEDKLADAVFESYNSGSRLKKELDELKGLLHETLKAKSDEQDKVSDHPEIKGLTEQLGALDTEIRDLGSQRRSIIEDVNKANKELSKLEGKYEEADDLDKPRFKNLMAIQERNLKDLERDWKSLDRDERKLDSEKRDLARKIKHTEDAIKVERANLRINKANQERSQGEFATTFREAVNSAAESLRLKTAEDKEYLYNVIQAEAIAYLRSLPEDSPGIDPEEFVARRVAAFARVHGLAKKRDFTQKSEELREAAGLDKKLPEKKERVDALPKNSAGQPVLPKGSMSAKQALEWRKKVLGA